MPGDNDGIGNEPPVILSVSNTSPMCGGAVHGDAVDLSAVFSDPNANDTHAATIDWGDGTVTSGTVNQASDTVSASHVYTEGGWWRRTLI